MGFWSMSQQGKDAENLTNQMPPWFWQQAQEQWGLGEDQQQRAQYMWQQYLQSVMDLQGEDQMSAEDLRNAGLNIMDAGGDADRRRQRTADLTSLLDSMPTADSIYGDSMGSLDELGRGIGATYDTNEGLLTQGADQRNAILNGLRNRLLGNIAGSFTQAGNESRDAYGRLISDVGTAYDAMGTQVGDSEAAQLAAIDANGPASEMQMARVARSYAPALASTAARLRRSGVGADSLEGGQQLQRVEAARSRGMDDAAADESRFTLSNRLQTMRDAISQRLGLGTSRVNLTTNLGTRTADINRDLTLGRGEAERGADAGVAAGEERVAADTTAGRLDNSNRSQDRTAQYTSARLAAIRARLGDSLNQFGVRVGMADRGNDDDTFRRELNTGAFQIGTGASDWNRNRALQRLGIMGDAAMGGFNVAGGTLNRGGSMAGTAFQMGNDVANRERANSGMGWRLLGSLGGAAINGAVAGLTGGASLAAGGAGGGASGWMGRLFGRSRNNQGGYRAPAYATE